MADAPLTIGGCPSCGSRSCVAMQCQRIHEETLAEHLQKLVKRAPSPPVAAVPATPYKHVEPTCEDAALLWAEIHHLRAAVQGPEGFATWQEAATAERVRRVKAERAAQPQPQPAQPLTGAPTHKPTSDEFIDAVIVAQHFRKGYQRCVSDEVCLNWYRQGWRDGERAHGITAPSTPTPPEVAP